jgi:bifunctional DNA-binding transcriptional regulator/antitoxin component of YhaV-PrlF toxin-antitoxin module
MTAKSESVVGSKEGLYPPKDIRRALGLKPGMKVRFKVEGGRMVVEPVPTIRELFKMGTTTSVTLEELRADRRELSRRLEGGRRRTAEDRWPGSCSIRPTCCPRRTGRSR